MKLLEALRLILHQTSANYRKEETMKNKMTYPLPPISTVIGAIHNACGYTEYHPMQISIQGKYESMHREPYKDYCFLNSTMDDREMLVKMNNANMLSLGFEIVAVALKPQGSSFRKNITIHVENEELMREYRELKNLNDDIHTFKEKRIKPLIELIKKRKKTLTEKKKKIKGNAKEVERISFRLEEIKNIEKEINFRMKEYEDKNYNIPVSGFRSLTTSVKFYEVLDEVSLIVHIVADENILRDIEKNIYRLKSIGRSEDFVDILSVKRVELKDICEEAIRDRYSAYVDANLIRNSTIYTRSTGNREIVGTKYNMNRDYQIIDNKRFFNKKKVIYVSDFTVEDTTENDSLFVDGEYIVNLL